MYAVIFEVLPTEPGRQGYLDIAASLRSKLEAMDGFISVERFSSLRRTRYVLSLSIWRDEAALAAWRNVSEHRAAQLAGRSTIFEDYRIRVAKLLLPRGSEASEGDPRVGISQAQQDKAKFVVIEESAFEKPEQHEAPSASDDYDSFGSFTGTGKRLWLTAWPNEAGATDWYAERLQERAGDATSALRLGRVVRDYGMFDRTHAPQHYPAVERRG